MSKRAVVILAEGFEEIEAVTCIDILRRAGVDVTIAGVLKKQIKGSHDIIITADKELTQVGEDFDACILPGGMPGSANLAASSRVSTLIKKLYDKGRIIAAICAAPAVTLAPLKILDGKSVTGFPGTQQQFDKTTSFKEDAVIIDRNIITSRGPGTALAFAIAIAGELTGKETAQKIKKATLSG